MLELLPSHALVQRVEGAISPRAARMRLHVIHLPGEHEENLLEPLRLQRAPQRTRELAHLLTQQRRLAARSARRRADILADRQDRAPRAVPLRLVQACESAVLNAHRVYFTRTTRS